MTTRRPGGDPTRRNRKQGTALRGRGQDNRMVVPYPTLADLRLPEEQLGATVRGEFQVGGLKLSVLVERARGPWIHACTVDDVLHVLRCVPATSLYDLAAVVLRVPTKKQALLEPHWGQILFTSALVGDTAPVILLDAYCPSKGWRWRWNNPAGLRELERLREAGHEVRSERGGWWVTPTLETYRTTQLFHTVPHELGHLADFRARGEAYWKRPGPEREDFAHRFADSVRKHWKARGVAPFPREQDPQVLARLGLRPAEFGLPTSSQG